MSQFTLNQDELKKLLRRAYEAGWHGTKELMESSVEEILDTVPTYKRHPLSEGMHNVFNSDSLSFNMDSPIVISSGLPDQIVITHDEVPEQVTLSPDAWRNAGDG